MYFGVYFGAQRGFVFCRGRTNSQPERSKNTHSWIPKIRGLISGVALANQTKTRAETES